MTALALETSATLPAWTPFFVLPSSSGLLVWNGGLPLIPWRSAPEEFWVTSGPGDPVPPSVSVDAMTWSRRGENVDVELQTRADQEPVQEILARWEWDADGILVPIGFFVVSGREWPAFVGRDTWSEALVFAMGATWLLLQQPDIADTTVLRADDAIVKMVDVRSTQPMAQPGWIQPQPADTPRPTLKPVWVPPRNARSLAAEQVKVWRR